MTLMCKSAALLLMEQLSLLSVLFCSDSFAATPTEASSAKAFKANRQMDHTPQELVYHLSTPPQNLTPI
jgi:hypothetical protein